MSDDAARRFRDNFLWQLRAAGHTPAQIARWIWQPYRVDDLRILGEGRDRDLRQIEMSVADVEAALAGLEEPQPRIDEAFFRREKTVLVMVPGFTHETLKNFSWHEQVQRKGSPHTVLMLHPEEGATREQLYQQGDGLKLVYLRYPRSNAASPQIVPAMFRMLQHSASLRRWTDEGYRLFFVGYSYGAPLSLELLADLHSGVLADDFILRSTRGFLGLCGDIGGSYLADDCVGDSPQLVNMDKLVAFARRHPWFGNLVGLGTPQLCDDMVHGVGALGHAVRQERARDYASRLPPQLQYYTAAAVMPLADYRRRWWQFNFDDWAMHRQALVTDPVTVYNDGQVALPDNLLPAAAQIPAQHNLHLGAVRTHHWGVSYRTFNLGINRFPRIPYYRALMQTVLQTPEASTA